MNIIFNRLYKIDLKANTVSDMPSLDGENDLKEYILELVSNIINDSDSRGFEFKSEKTEVRGWINDILLVDTRKKEEYDKPTQGIAQRLLQKEIEAQDKLTKSKFTTEIQKGIIVVSLAGYNDGRKKVIISKAENYEYIDDLLYKKRGGLPIKKKIYKAFIGEFSPDNEVIKVSVYDTNSTISAYWWREFLELLQIRTDDYNTEKAFQVIESKILDPIKKVSKSDYITLWNATVHYFRTKSEFAVNDFIENIVENFQPFDSRIKLDDLGEKIRKLSDKNDFDNRFSIKKELIKSRFKNTIGLTHQIDLHFKEDIPNITDIIKTHKDDDGSKYVMIKSESGYEHFESLRTTNDNNS